MKVLFIGGTGTISTAVSAHCIQQGIDLYLLNRGNSNRFVPPGAKVITADITDTNAVKNKLGDLTFDVVADFIAFTPEHIARDIDLFSGRCAQYVFISSASAYQKPLASPFITESTPLYNPFWQYSRDKIACEEVLMKAYRTNAFPFTVVRPSHTYGDSSVPVACHGKKGSFSVIDRMLKGKKVIVPGDGTSLWTLTHNTDFAKAFCGLLGNVHTIGETYHITSDESLTWNQVYTTIASALGVEAKLVHIASNTLARCSDDFLGGLVGDKSHSVIFDNSKVKRAVPEYTATVRFDQGVRQSLDYILSHPECQTPDPEFDAWCDAVIAHYEKMETNLPSL